MRDKVIQVLEIKMIDKRVNTFEEALQGIADSSTVLLGGFGQAGSPVELIEALIDQGATNLTVVSNNAGEGEIFRQIFDLNDQLFWQQEEYYSSIDVDLVVRIGEHTWRGILGSGSSGPPYSIEVQDVKVGGDTADRFRVTVAEDDGGTFPSFPGGLTETDTPRIQIEFSDLSSGVETAPSYLDSTDLTCVSQSITRITAARGFISTGSGDLINFSVDPASIRTRTRNLGFVELREVRYDSVFDLSLIHI